MKRIVIEVDLKGNTAQIQKTTREFQTAFDTIRKAATTASGGVSGKDFASAIFGSKVGGIIGAGSVGAAVLETVNAVKSLTSTIYEAGKGSLVAAANFEQTRNALTYATGSMRTAKEELAAVDKVARNTTGLRLEEAEVGYSRLRNLGFAAQTSRNFLEGLAKQKLISRADEQSVDRVIVNLTQLRAGSSQATKDIKEIVHAMPSMVQVFDRAFGTSQASKVARFFNENPAAALDKLSAAMKDSGNVSGGLTGAWGKLEDAWTKAVRTIGTPVIEPLTDDIKSLTEWIDKNQRTWQEWGTIVKGVYQDVTSYFKRDGGGEKGFFGKVGDAINSVNPAFLLAKNYRQDLLSRGNENIYVSENIAQLEALKKAHDEQLALKKEQDKQKRAAQEKADEERLQLLKANLSSETDTIKSNFAVRNALLDSRLRLSLQSEIDYTQKSGKLKNEEARLTFSNTKANLTEQLKLEAGNLGATAKLKAELAKVTAKYNSDIAVNELETMKRVAEIERQILEKRRQDAVEFKQLQIKELSLSGESKSFDLNRNISLGINVQQSFDQLKTLTQTNYQQIAEITRQQYQVQLRNEKLTNEERVNLEKQMYLDLQGLAEKNRQEILEIEDKSFNERIRRFELFSSRMKATIDAGGSFLSSISFANKGSVVRALTSQFFEDDPDLMISRIKTELGAAKSIYDSLMSAREKMTNADRQTRVDLSDKIAGQIQVIESLKSNLESLQSPKDGLRAELIALARLGKQFDEGKVSINDFDKAQKLLLKTTQDYTLFGLEQEKKSLEEKIKIFKSNKREIEAISAQTQLDQITNQIDLAKIKNSADALNQYRNSFEGLTETLNKFQSGDKVAWLEFFDELRKQDVQNQIGQIKELARVQIELNNKGTFNPLEAQGKLLDYLNRNTKSLTQSYVDFRTTLADGAIQQIDSPFEKLNRQLEKLPPIIRGVGSAFVGLANDIIRSYSQKLIMRLLGLDSTGSAGQSRGNSGFSFGGLFSGLGSGGNSGASGFLPGEMGGLPTGIAQRMILGGNGGILSKIPMLGGLFGGAGAAIGAANGATIAATAGGLSTSATLSGTVGLLGGGTYTAAGASGGGLMSSLGSLFTNPWTAVAAGAAIGGFFLFRHLFGDKTLKKLREASDTTYGIKVKDKSVLENLKAIGESQFGKGQARRRAFEVVKLEPSKDVLRSYAEMTGQSTSRIGASKADLQNEFYSGNRFVSKFGGFREFGGRILAGHSYVIGEKRPEVVTFKQDGYVHPSVDSYLSKQQGNNNSPQMMMMLLQGLGAIMENFQATMSRFQAVSPNQVLMATDSSIIGNKVSQASSNNPDFNYNLQRNQGAGIIW